MTPPTSKPPTQLGRTVRRGAWGIALFWLAVMAGLYFVFDRVEQRRNAVPMAQMVGTGELVIPRGRDGHFRVAGTVNGQSVVFLVDTGASTVTVSEELAQRAGLSGGEPVTFRTANGSLQGRVLRRVPVSVGPSGSVDVSVAVGLAGHQAQEALLGQSFLSRFEMRVAGNQMTLIPLSR